MGTHVCLQPLRLREAATRVRQLPLRDPPLSPGPLTAPGAAPALGSGLGDIGESGGERGLSSAHPAAHGEAQACEDARFIRAREGRVTRSHGRPPR